MSFYGLFENDEEVPSWVGRVGLAGRGSYCGIYAPHHRCIFGGDPLARRAAPTRTSRSTSNPKESTVRRSAAVKRQRPSSDSEEEPAPEEESDEELEEESDVEPEEESDEELEDESDEELEDEPEEEPKKEPKEEAEEEPEEPEDESEEEPDKDSDEEPKKEPKKEPKREPKEESEQRFEPVVAATNGGARRANVPLIPKDCASALEGTKSFSSVFEKRYGANRGLVPPFFIGSLQEAMEEAFDKPIIADRRPLALYIHFDGTDGTMGFNEELFFDETVALLRSNFILWPWDVTAKENQAKLMTWLIECDLYSVISDLADVIGRSTDGFSALFLLTKDGDKLRVDDKIGTYTPHEAGKTYDTLAKVMKQYADVKTRAVGRKRARQPSL